MTVGSEEENLILLVIERLATEQHLLEVLHELARRARQFHDSNESAKRMIGVGNVQAIGLLMSVPYATARQLALDNHL